MAEPAAAPAFFCASNSDGVNTPQGNTPLIEADRAAAAAPFLFFADDLGSEKLEAVGEFTGERLLARRPETYRAIVRMAAEGLSGSSIARALAVSRNTVAAVKEREGFTIEQQKKELLATIRRGSQIAAERVVELIPALNSAKDAAITLAVLVDKAQLLAGEATSRVEKVDASQDKLREMLAALPVLDAEVFPGTGPSVPAPEQKGTGMPALTDKESEGLTYAQPSASATLSATSTPTTIDAPETTARPASSLQGGEGVGVFAGPPIQPTHQTPQKIFGKGIPSTAPDAPPAVSNPTTAP